MRRRTTWLPDGQIRPWHISDTPGSAPSIKTLHCNSMRLPSQDVKVFEDHASGARSDRPGLQKAPDYAREGDILIVWKLDRLGHSLPHLIKTVTALEKRGVGFRTITEAIDTTTPGGRLVFHLFGALGQFERDLIGERTRAGLVAAAAHDRKGRRKPVVTGEKFERARVIIGKELTVREAATRLRVGKTALYEALRN
jgi:DNA invertase Pin-like site-specific DNA recombinase